MPQAAEAGIKRVAQQADVAAAHRRLGNELLAKGASADAIESYQRSLLFEPLNVRAYNNMGQALMRLNRRDEARAIYERALEIDPRYAFAHNNLGIVFYEEGAFAEAAACYERAIEIEPSFAEAHYNRGNALHKLDRLPAALAAYDQALMLRPNAVETLFARGNVLLDLARFEAAVESYQKLLALAPRHADALSNCASALLTLKRPEEALELCERAIQVKPDHAAAYNNLGGAFRRLNRFDESLAACEYAIALQPNYAKALANCANIMLACNQFAAALEYCDRALALEPDLADAHERRAAALVGEKRPEEAALAYDRVVELAPFYPFALGAALAARLTSCDWTTYEESRARVIRAVESGRQASQPFALLSIVDSPDLHLRCVRSYAQDQLSGVTSRSVASYRHERIRIAYLSADFHEHATAMLMAGLFEAHDRARFEIVAISFGGDDSGPMRQRLLKAFDRFIDVKGLSDAQTVELLQSLEIDIAVDLKGFTGEARTGILARRAAPIQVSYLGYPGTTGLETMDYVLADPVVLPFDQQPYYTEQIVHLQDSYQVNDNRRVIAETTPERVAPGFVFCCFNNHYKLTPTVFGVWMQILQRVPGSVLWLLEDNNGAAKNLRRAAEARGVSGERLFFAPRLPADQHLARHRCADLFLDTLPYNAHTTTSDALWAGLPVLTCKGNAFAGRVAASLLHAVGLPDMVTSSLDEYLERAVELASAPEKLADIRERLVSNRDTAPLFDTQRFCRNIEAAYITMWERQQAGLPPQSFAV